MDTATHRNGCHNHKPYGERVMVQDGFTTIRHGRGFNDAGTRATHDLDRQPDDEGLRLHQARENQRRPRLHRLYLEDQQPNYRMNTDHYAQMYLIASLVFLIAAGLLYFTRMHYQALAPKRRYKVYRHKKTGGHYAILFVGKLEADSSTCVIYAPVDQLDNPTPWVRDYNEFRDGRFEFVGTITYEYTSPTTKGK